MPIVILMCEAGGVLQWLQPLFLPYKFCGDSKWVLNPAQQQVSVARPFFVTFADTHGVNAAAVLWGLFLLSAWLCLYLTTTQKWSTHFHSNHHSGWHHHPFVEDMEMSGPGLWRVNSFIIVFWKQLHSWGPGWPSTDISIKHDTLAVLWPPTLNQSWEKDGFTCWNTISYHLCPLEF